MKKYFFSKWTRINPFLPYMFFIGAASELILSNVSMAEFYPVSLETSNWETKLDGMFMFWYRFYDRFTLYLIKSADGYHSIVQWIRVYRGEGALNTHSHTAQHIVLLPVPHSKIYTVFYCPPVPHRLQGNNTEIVLGNNTPKYGLYWDFLML